MRVIAGTITSSIFHVGEATMPDDNLLHALVSISLATHYPFLVCPLLIACILVRAALLLAPRPKTAQARITRDVYEDFVIPNHIAYALRGAFAPHALIHRLSEQQMLGTLLILAPPKPENISSSCKMPSCHMQADWRCICRICY
ncbi:MAG: hypothetical protein NZL91_07130 [Thermoflexales bacterium]|nr:hypothetical protein [Thermoflexales bacterium]